MFVSELPYIFGVTGSRQVALFFVGVPLQRGMTLLFLLFLLVFSLSLLAFCLRGFLGGVDHMLGCSVSVWPNLGVSGPGSALCTQLGIWKRSCFGVRKFSIPCLTILWAVVPFFCVTEGILFCENHRQNPGQIAAFPILFWLDSVGMDICIVLPCFPISPYMISLMWQVRLQFICLILWWFSDRIGIYSFLDHEVFYFSGL